MSKSSSIILMTAVWMIGTDQFFSHTDVPPLQTLVKLLTLLVLTAIFCVVTVKND